MDGLLSEKMKELMSDPDAMARVMDMAGRLFSEQPTAGEAPAQEEKRSTPAQALPSLAKGGGRAGEDDRVNLIRALCPYLNDQRREAAMALSRILKLISMADAAGIFKNSL
jgi:hypothetical protein